MSRIERHGGGLGSNGRERRQGHRHNYASANSALKKGLCNDLGNNVLDYGHKSAADQMRISRENLVQHISTKYEQYVSNNLHNKTDLNITAPVHSPQVLVRHATR